MVKLVIRLIPDKKEGEGDPAEPVYLDDRLMAQPAAALQLAAKEILHLAFLVREQLHLTTGMVRRKEEGQPAAGIEQREKLKGLGNKITEYLSGLFSAGVLTEGQSLSYATQRFDHSRSRVVFASGHGSSSRALARAASTSWGRRVLASMHRRATVSVMDCAEIVLMPRLLYRRATPVSRAAFATAEATASATRGSNAPGMMFSSLRSSSVMRSAMA